MTTIWNNHQPEQLTPQAAAFRIATALKAAGIEALITGQLSAIFPDGTQARFLDIEVDTRGLSDQAR